jgi:hypothetical protein
MFWGSGMPSRWGVVYTYEEKQRDESTVKKVLFKGDWSQSR